MVNWKYVYCLLKLGALLNLFGCVLVLFYNTFTRPDITVFGLAGRKKRRSHLHNTSTSQQAHQFQSYPGTSTSCISHFRTVAIKYLSPVKVQNTLPPCTACVLHPFRTLPIELLSSTCGGSRGQITHPSKTCVMHASAATAAGQIDVRQA